MRGIGEHKDESLHAKISPFRGDTAFERLEVAQVRFRLGEPVGATNSQDPVATSRVTGDRNSNFRVPDRTRRQAPAKSLEQRDVRLIPDDISIGMQGRGQRQPENRGIPCGELDRHRMFVAPLEPRQPIVADAESSTHLPETSPG